MCVHNYISLYYFVYWNRLNTGLSRHSYLKMLLHNHTLSQVVVRMYLNTIWKVRLGDFKISFCLQVCYFATTCASLHVHNNALHQ